MIDVVEAPIAALRAALESGRATAVELVDAYLARIDAYDTPDSPTALNAVVVRNPDARDEAAASDARRARGQTLGPLDGIPYTAKDSYLVARTDRGRRQSRLRPTSSPSATRSRSSACAPAGPCCLGLTNMPPMANGGMQRGVYGRAESPYNADYLTAAVRLGLVQRLGHRDRGQLRRLRARRGDLVVSGRAPASNNALCAYTPSRGRHLGARQLAARADHGRRRAAHPHHGRPARGARRDRRRRPRDPRRLLARAAVGADPAALARCGRESYVALSRATAPAALAADDALGVPRMYVNADPEAGTAEPDARHRRSDRASASRRAPR